MNKIITIQILTSACGVLIGYLLILLANKLKEDKDSASLVTDDNSSDVDTVVHILSNELRKMNNINNELFNRYDKLYYEYQTLKSKYAEKD